MKKVFCLILALLLLSAFIPAAAADEDNTVTFTTKVIANMDLPVSEWLGSKVYRAGFGAILIAELGGKLFEVDDLDVSKDQFIGVVNGDIIYAMPSASGYLIFLVDVSTGSGVMLKIDFSNSSLVKGLLEDAGATSIYTIDSDTFISVVSAMLEKMQS